MRRTITLPDDDGMGAVAGSVKLGELEHVGPRALAVSYPDTLEIIHRPASLAPPPAPPEAPPPAPETPEPAALDDLPPLSAPDQLAALLQEFRDERHRRRSVRAAKVLIGLLATGLLAVWLLHPPRSGGDENRAPTAFPSLTPSGLLNGKNYRQADAALRDRLALRKYVVKTVGEASRDKMNTSLSSNVVIGSTGVPFISEDFVFPCQYGFDPATVDTGLRELQALGRLTGKSITVAIAPDKSSILTDQLGSRGSALMTCSNQVRQSTEKTWPDTPDSAVLYTWKQLAVEQKAHPGKVFQRGDSHWTSQGALIWSRALIARLIAQGDAPAKLGHAPVATRLPDVPADNDLYRMMGISRSETVPVWQVVRPRVKIRAKSLPTPSGRGTGLFHSVSATEPLITGRTLVINDSFFSRAEGELAPYFSDLQVLHWSDFMTAVSRGNLPHFDRIIIETVQRGWPERAGWLAQGQPIHNALAKELSRASTDKSVHAPEPVPSS